MGDFDRTGPYICGTCGRDQDSVISITGPGEKPDWPRCPDCPAPRSGIQIVVEDGAVPVLPPPPVVGVENTKPTRTLHNTETSQ